MSNNTAHKCVKGFYLNLKDTFWEKVSGKERDH